ncbi:MAG: FAD-binding protein [Eubacterium sp.]|nr:FAD-binding protein [Eubacterium sp.]
MENFDINEIHEQADILIVGGGIAGLSAAVSAKEKNPDADVLIVEKQTTGYGGKANKGGGVLQYFDLEHISPEDFIQYHAHSVGCYLGDQDVMKKYVGMNNEMLDRMEQWGVTIPKKRIPTGPMTYMVGIDLNVTLNVRRTAEKMGVRIIDKVTICDFLTDDNKVRGAVGYSIVDGTFYTFNAKAVILASGSQNYKFAPMWSNGRGDGIAAAYRAGAKMRNTEFGNFAQLYKKNTFQEDVFCENHMYNALGENVTKNFRRFPEADVSASAIREWYEQMSEGKGPVYVKIPPRDEELMQKIWDRPYGIPFWTADHAKAAGKDKEMEMVPGLVAEQSPVKVNIDMETSIDGMYAAGDVSYCGSGAPGAVPAPPGRNRGSGILNAVFAGIVSGEHAADYIKEVDNFTLDDFEITRLKNDAFAPLLRPSGLDPEEVISDVQNILCPVENSIFMSESRLKIALKKLGKVKEKVSQLKADDYHQMLYCHEAESMVLCAEMQLRASMMRKESRGWFLREDYPMMDNKNWLEWIIVQNKDGEMTFDTEKVPVEKYDVQPPVMM